VQLPLPSQTSSVHGLPSLWHAVPSGALHESAASLHLALQVGLPAHGSPVPMQLPAWQASVLVQNAPSLHGVPSLAATASQAPVVVLHVPVLHGAVNVEQSTAEPPQAPLVQ